MANYKSIGLDLKGNIIFLDQDSNHTSYLIGNALEDKKIDVHAKVRFSNYVTEEALLAILIDRIKEKDKFNPTLESMQLLHHLEAAKAVI